MIALFLFIIFTLIITTITITIIPVLNNSLCNGEGDRDGSRKIIFFLRKAFLDSAHVETYFIQLLAAQQALTIRITSVSRFLGEKPFEK